MPYTPLSMTNDPDSQKRFLGPHEGVPPWLQQSLWNWVATFIRDDRVVTREPAFNDGPVERLVRSLHLTAVNRTGGTSSVVRSIFDRAMREPEFLLDVVDNLTQTNQSKLNRILEEFLHEAGSVWCVDFEQYPPRLMRRVSPEVRAVFDDVVSSAPRPGEHLKTAWAAAFGRKPDSTTSYRESVRAVEAAACGVVAPGDKMATLGTVIARLRDTPGKFGFDLQLKKGDPIEVVRGMCELLWHSQVDRHGTSDQNVPLNVSPSSAEAAVHLATTLVAWFAAGRIRLVP